MKRACIHRALRPARGKSAPRLAARPGAHHVSFPVHRFVPDPDSAPATLDAAQLVAIKALVRELLALPADTFVTISESPCADPGCPLLETVVAVFPEGAPARRWRLTRPRAALTRLMLMQTLACPPETPTLATPPTPRTAPLDSPVTLDP